MGTLFRRVATWPNTSPSRRVFETKFTLLTSTTLDTLSTSAMFSSALSYLCGLSKNTESQLWEVLC